ncbi:pyridoxamine 5'-phosphate oxidase family protein [Streptomyces resistomycificus]|uniref:Pyridoxamine 5'-phosphate oxidase n=1 Tax=Streptomyces resistomycificus TaxID=67356 RepID=A0A0L8LAS5_9ACTN|nr:pyridoxamine 5'-phosphate oxidase family protein [Streptomyces resistomycificus]KOG35235.1 pyridoxamine 5'-phosphate oxidase [Streptomyces resistomycificus]KUN99903.1 pyridoxamine 5'-phosphate oxidase [Streptomyces resistomycificus]
MRITEPSRTPEQRKQDVLARLERESDVWVASADAGGLPCLVALWFVWDGEAVWVSTRLTNPTGRNLRDGGRARLAFGDTQDVVLLDGDVRTFEGRAVPHAAVEAFVARTGWDPRADSASYAFFRIRPHTVQAYHGEHEMRGRHLMRSGEWVV